MSHYDLRIKAREMRSGGESVKVIAKRLGISKSTCSLWVRDIILTVDQLENLKKREIKGAELGRLRGALVQKERRLDKISKEKQNAFKELAKISDRDLFVIGIALYWAEGAKNRNKVEFINSDPEMINLIILWLRKYFGIKANELRARVGINESHKARDEKVRKYWSEKTKIPLNQFTLTSFKKVKSTKVYQNFEDHFGTLGISVLKPARIYYRMMGLVYGLSEAGCRLASQGVS